MALTSYEQVTPPSLDEDKDGFEITRVFRITSDTATTVAAVKAAAISDSHVPAPYAEHPTVDNAKLVSYNVIANSEYTFDITCNYSSNSDDQGEGKDGDGNPTNNPMDVRYEYNWDSKEVEIPVLKDLGGVDAVNAAGDRFDPPVMRKVYRRVLSVTLNSTSFNSTVISNYVGYCNNGVFLGAAAKRVLCTSIKTTPADKDGVFYDRVTLTFEFLNPIEDDFTPTKILNAGMRKKVGAVLELIEIGTAPNRWPVNAPVPLRADGSDAIAATDPPNYIELDLIPSANFSLIPASL